LFIVKQWNLKGDWWLDARGKNEIVIVVKNSRAKKIVRIMKGL
jgi:hypothetical protein